MNFESTTAAHVNIAVAERETGLGKDTLRVWERRYGFPRPLRDAHGDRLYPGDQIIRLRLMKQLLDRGYRPGKVAAATEEELQGWVAGIQETAPPDEGPPQTDTFQQELLRGLRGHAPAVVRNLLARRLAQDGLESFILDFLPVMNAAVGDAWASGQLAIFEEHFYTEQLKSLLRQAILALPHGTGAPKVLLTTVPGEQHVLGLLMVEALLAMRGVATVSLGTETPLHEIAAAAAAHRADIVALSFSIAFPQRQLVPLLKELRSALPAAAILWVGGGGTARLQAALPGVERLEGLADIQRLLDAYPAQAAAGG